MIKPGRYRHYKGKDYRLVANAVMDDTREPCVLYVPLYGDGELTVRTAREWVQYVDGGSGQPVPRFTFVGE